MNNNIKCELNDDPLIPEGEYKVKCIKSEVKPSPWGFKVRLHLEIISGEYNNINLIRHYNLKTSKKPNPDGEVIWENGTKSAYIREWRRLFGKASDGDYPHSKFDDKCFLIQVTSVKQDSKKQDIGKVNYYSKAERIIKEIDCQINTEVDWA
jgi:hypothetical protein